MFKCFVLSEQSKNILLDIRTQQIHPCSVFLCNPYQVDLRESQCLQLSKLQCRRRHWSSFGWLESPVDCHYYLLKEGKEEKKRHFVQGCSIFGIACNDCYSNVAFTFRSIISPLKIQTLSHQGKTAELYRYKDVLLVLNLQSRRIHSVPEKGSTLPLPAKSYFLQALSYLIPRKRRGLCQKVVRVTIASVFLCPSQHHSNTVSVQLRARHYTQAQQIALMKTNPCQRKKEFADLPPKSHSHCNNVSPLLYIQGLRVLKAVKHIICAEQLQYFVQNNLWSKIPHE